MARNKPNTPQRQLPYDRTNYDEKVIKFKKRVEEQVEVIKIGIREGTVNDPKIAQKYVDKITRFFANPYFEDEKAKTTWRLIDLKNHLKVAVAKYKELSNITQEWVTNKRGSKIIVANTYKLQNGTSQNFYYPYEIQRFYNSDIAYLNSVLPKYQSEHLLIAKLLGILSDENLLKKTLSCKESWKVSTLKEELRDWAQDFPFEVEFELEELFAHKFLKSKKYLDMTVKDFRTLVKNRKMILEEITKWIEEQKRSINVKLKEVEDNIDNIKERNIYDIYRDYDAFISQYSAMKKEYDEKYSLYRFAQGLIERDIFDTLFK